MSILRIKFAQDRSKEDPGKASKITELVIMGQATRSSRVLGKVEEGAEATGEGSKDKMGSKVSQAEATNSRMVSPHQRLGNLRRLQLPLLQTPS